VLNRLYIVIGVVVILALAAAFVVPHLVPWGNYRARMEALAGQALGTPVKIKGDIAFSLLPAPHLTLGDVEIGPPQQPVLSVGAASADFSLIDFLRDRYSMTSLVLDHPELAITVDRNGGIDTGIHLAGAESQVALSIAQARIEDGTVRVTDAGAGRTYAVDGLAGDLTVGAIGGPFGFSGRGRLAGQDFSLRINASALDPHGTTQVTAFAQPQSKAYTVNLQGALATAGVPHLTGELDYRQAPPANNPNGIIGALTFSTRLDMTPEKGLLSSFVLVPDENRGATRLAGSATIDLGPKPGFTASLTSSVLATPPPNVTTDQGPQPYELTQLLRSLPVLPVPPIAGEITAEVDEIDLDTLSLDNAGLDATTDGKTWTVKNFTGQLPGGTNVTLAGQITAPQGATSFTGTLSLTAKRLDALAALWRRPPPGNPLFNMPGSFTSKISLTGTTVGFTDGQLTLDGVKHQLNVLADVGHTPNLTVSGQFGTLSPADSTALLALVPDIVNDPSAGVTFPQGAISLTADAVSYAGLTGHQLDLEGKWGGGAIEISRLSADDLGGIRFNVGLALSGTFVKPRISGDGQIGIGQGGGPALDRLFDWLGTPAGARALLVRSLPATLKAHLDDPDNSGAQGLSLSGKAGAADVTFLAQLNGGVLKPSQGPVDATVSLDSSDPAAFTAQLGLGDVSLMAASGPMTLAARATGDPAGSMAANIDLEDGGDSISFNGNVTPGGLTAMAGNGKLRLTLADSTALAAELGLGGLYTPPLKASADLAVSPDGRISLDNLSGSSGGDNFSGKLALAHDAGGAAVSGELKLDDLDLAGLVAGIGSPTALMTSSGSMWPDGPIYLGEEPRPTTGSVTITTPKITRGGAPFLTDARFDFDWDATISGVHGLTAAFGPGKLTLDANLCCAGPLADKQLGGQATLNGVPLDQLLPPAPAATLSGTLQGSARFSGTGDSIAALLGNLSGDGSFEVDDLAVQKFDPGAFATVASLGGIINIKEADLSAKVASAIDAGPFSVPKLNGGFTIAAGTVQLANLGAEAGGTKLFGGATLKLADLALGGSFALTPEKTLDAAGLVGPTTSSVTANLSGTLLAPVRTLDIASMVETIKVHALENEVTRLEKLKAQQDAQAKAYANANKEAVEDQQRRELEARQAVAAKARQAAARAALDAAAVNAAKAADAAKAALAKLDAAKAAAVLPAPASAAAPASSTTAAHPAPLPVPPPVPTVPPVPAPRPSTPAAHRPAPAAPPLNLEVPPVQYQPAN